MSTLGPLSVAALTTALLVPIAPARAATPTCQGVPATIVGTAGDDRLVGTAGADVVVARGGDDVVLGRGGDDLVCGGDGADTLRGGPGADRLYGQREARITDRGGTYFIADRLDGGPGDDVLDVGGDHRWVNWGSHGDLDYSAAAAGVTVDLGAGTATGQGADTVVDYAGTGCDFSCYGVGVFGSAHDDQLTGSSASNLLVGNGGDDVLAGLDGADELHAEAQYGERSTGDDHLDGGPGVDAVYSYAGRDVLDGGSGDDTVWQTGGGPSEVHGGSGGDRVAVWFPTSPGFVLDGGPGTDDGQVLGPHRPGAGGRPEDATYDGVAGTASSADVVWGQVGAVETLFLGGAITWTCTGTAGADVSGCS